MQNTVLDLLFPDVSPQRKWSLFLSFIQMFSSKPYLLKTELGGEEEVMQTPSPRGIQSNVK